MNALAKVTPFQFNTIEVRVFEVDDVVWFVASDLAKILEYRTAADMTRILDEDERGTHIVRTPSGDQDMITINESGFFHAILKSRKPEAQAVRKWVTSEVLPAIRKTGRYELTPEPPRELRKISFDQHSALKMLINVRTSELKNHQYEEGRRRIEEAIQHALAGTDLYSAPAARFDELVALIMATPLNGNGGEVPKHDLGIHWPVDRWIEANPWFDRHQYRDQPKGDRASLTIATEMLHGMDARSSIHGLLTELEKRGCNVEACRMEYAAMRHYVSRLSEFSRDSERFAACMNNNELTFNYQKQQKLLPATLKKSKDPTPYKNLKK